MLSSSRLKRAGGSKSNKTVAGTAQQVAFELKQRVILSLNKLSDRDTHHIGANDLENIANGLTQEGVAPFISCIIDTDSGQKSAVRKECIRLMATLARCHGSMLLPHLGKMMLSIVKRLKDTDTVVRDACVEAVGVFANTVRSSSVVSGSCGGESTFITIVKPLFEALGEQNRYVQSGSALCLTRVIDETNDPPIPVLSQMMPRVIKLLKNPHFMAKPAVIELIRSIVQVGGASTEHSLSAAMTCILETLKSSDWITRKAASEALATIAVGASGHCLVSLRTSCICSLERCRFDKVKPVRDSILHALQCWKTLAGISSPEPSEAGSSTKENLNGNYSDAASAINGRWRELSNRKASTVSALNCTTISVASNKRDPSAIQKDCSNHVQNHHNYPTSKNWHTEISPPKAHATSMIGESAYDRSTYANFRYDAKFDYDTAGKADFSSTSDRISGNFETKHVTMEEGDSSTLTRSNYRFSTDEVDNEGSVITQEHKSLDSTVTEQSSQGIHECCLHTVSELTSIKKQLSEIENKQSTLLELLQVYTRNSGDSLLALQMTVHNLENAVNKISNTVSHNDKHSSKITINNQNVTCSPRVSITAPRPSVESNFSSRQTSSLKDKSKEAICVNSSLKSKDITSAAKESVKLLREPRLSKVRNHPPQKDVIRGTQIDTICSRSRESNRNTSSIKHDRLEVKYEFWKQMKELLHTGDIESAYAEALRRGDDICLIELMDITGPVLERLSCETTAVVLGILTTLFWKQRFTDSIIPWFLQVVDLNIDEDRTQLVLPYEASSDFLYALLELAAMECIVPSDKTAITEFATKLSQKWSETPVRKALAPTKRGY